MRRKSKGVSASDGPRRKNTVQNVASVITMVTAVGSFYLAIAALHVSGQSNKAAESAAESAKEANRIAQQANLLSGGADKTAKEANELAKEANEIAKEASLAASEPVFRFEAVDAPVWGPKSERSTKKDCVTKIYNDGAPVYDVEVETWYFIQFEVRTDTRKRTRLALVKHEGVGGPSLVEGEIVEGLTGQRMGLVAAYRITSYEKTNIRQLTESFQQFVDAIEQGVISKPAFLDSEVNDDPIIGRPADGTVEDFFWPQEYMRITYRDIYKKAHVVWINRLSAGQELVTEEHVSHLFDACGVDLTVLFAEDIKDPELLAGWCVLFNVTPATIMLPRVPAFWQMRPAPDANDAQSQQP